MLAASTADTLLPLPAACSDCPTGLTCNAVASKACTWYSCNPDTGNTERACAGFCTVGGQGPRGRAAAPELLQCHPQQQQQRGNSCVK